MKVRVELTVEVDPMLWAQVNGCGSVQSDVRQDVREFVADIIQQTKTFSETGAEVLRTN